MLRGAEKMYLALSQLEKPAKRLCFLLPVSISKGYRGEDETQAIRFKRFGTVYEDKSLALCHSFLIFEVMLLFSFSYRLQI